MSYDRVPLTGSIVYGLGLVVFVANLVAALRLRNLVSLFLSGRSPAPRLGAELA